MKKLMIASLIILAVCVGFATPLDTWIEVEWPDGNGAYYTITNDDNMAGDEDTSRVIQIPAGVASMDYQVDADTGSTSVLLADDDSAFTILYLLPIGQGTAGWVLHDSIIEGAQADSGGTGTNHWAQVADTFWYEIITPEADSAAGLLHTGASNLYARKYAGIQLVQYTLDTTGIAFRHFIRFNSRGNSWEISGEKSGH